MGQRPDSNKGCDVQVAWMRKHVTSVSRAEHALSVLARDKATHHLSKYHGPPVLGLLVDGKASSKISRHSSGLAFSRISHLIAINLPPSRLSI